MLDDYHPVFEDQNGALREKHGGAAYTNVRIRDGARVPSQTPDRRVTTR
jgi:hypothetical protein